MATADISLRGRRKTMLIYRAESGLALRQVDTRSTQVREIPLSAEDMDKLVEKWPSFRDALSNAGAPNVSPSTRSQNGSRGSQEQDNSPSSTEAGGMQ